jgi:ribosomal protein L29
MISEIFKMSLDEIVLELAELRKENTELRDRLAISEMTGRI